MEFTDNAISKSKAVAPWHYLNKNYERFTTAQRYAAITIRSSYTSFVARLFSVWDIFPGISAAQQLSSCRWSIPLNFVIWVREPPQPTLAKGLDPTGKLERCTKLHFHFRLLAALKYSNQKQTSLSKSILFFSQPISIRCKMSETSCSSRVGGSFIFLLLLLVARPTYMYANMPSDDTDPWLGFSDNQNNTKHTSLARLVSSFDLKIHPPAKHFPNFHSLTAGCMLLVATHQPARFQLTSHPPGNRPSHRHRRSWRSSDTLTYSLFWCTDTHAAGLDS